MPKLLLILWAYLVVWVPMNFALLASRALPSLGVRSWVATLEITVHAFVTLACGVSGWMLRARTAAGRPLAAAALMANAVASAQSLYVSTLPHDVPPGLAGPLMLAAFINATAWVLYLYRSKHLRSWLAP